MVQSRISSIAQEEERYICFRQRIDELGKRIPDEKQQIIALVQKFTTENGDLGEIAVRYQKELEVVGTQSKTRGLHFHNMQHYWDNEKIQKYRQFAQFIDVGQWNGGAYGTKEELNATLSGVALGTDQNTFILPIDKNTAKIAGGLTAYTAFSYVICYLAKEPLLATHLILPTIIPGLFTGGYVAFETQKNPFEKIGTSLTAGAKNIEETIKQYHK